MSELESGEEEGWVNLDAVRIHIAHTFINTAFIITELWKRTFNIYIGLILC